MSSTAITVAQIGNWARSIMEHPHVLFFDTETTGLREQDEIVEIALVGKNGEAVLNTLVQCQQDVIPLAATEVHGIDKAMLHNAPTFQQVWPLLEHLLTHHIIVIYNAEFDLRLLGQTLYRYGMKRSDDINAQCLMLQYSDYIAEPGRYRNSYAYQSLAKACSHFDIPQPLSHRAFGDAFSALQVMEKLTQLAPETGSTDRITLNIGNSTTQA